MTLAKRIIPCLDVDNGRVVKGIKFKEVKDAGDPVEFANRYTQQGADELVFLDITASQQRREIIKKVVRNVARVIDIPFTVGGGIKRLEDARDMLLSGADKVSINTGAVKNPELITELMSIFGRQCIVVAIDVKKKYNDLDTKKKNIIKEYDKNNNMIKKYWFEVRIYGGKEGTGIDAIEWAREVEKLGAGEILLTSIDADGTEEGYDLKLNDVICKTVSIPVIASGGCGKAMHMLEVFKKTNVDAALAASIFHYEKSTINKVKRFLKRNNIHVRI
ncbi:MAG TPA: imidazole glycerol phosphate synthase subunit HisF [Nitrososphaeraceae archaeon]|jgi:cyclase|nr:imidazole glycerol phosphate synthase subunit HisF [Nitrososphaeraceae archaeon]